MGGRRITEQLTDTADVGLIAAAREGDGDAFAALWSIYHPQLLRFLRARGLHEADDVASRVWIDVRRALPRFDGDGDAIRGWIFAIAVRRSIDRTRRVHRRGEVISDASPDTASGATVDERLEQTESLADTWKMLSPLPPATAQVIMLRIVNELSVADVAAITGNTESNVRVLTHRGLALLRTVAEQAELSRDQPDSASDAFDVAGSVV